MLILGMLLSLTNAYSVWGAGEESERPNVILILTDDQGYGDVGFHGNKQLKTPNLDRMAKDGIELTRFYCSPVCAPTRASLMTGRYFYRTGVVHTSRGGAKMQGNEITLAELLKQAGYKTGIFGKWHLGDNYPMRPEDQGFEETLIHKGGGIGQSPDQPNSYFDSRLWKNGKRIQADGYCTDVFFQAAIEFMEQQKQEQQPFFVYLPTNAPHTPLEIDRSYWEPYQKMGLNETTARVYGMVQNLDENVGKLMVWLKKQDLLNNTIVIFLGDNGPQQKRFTDGLRGRKSWVYEGGIRVPFVAQWPGHFQGGSKSDQIAAHIDLLPTLLSLTKTPRPASLALDGIDLTALLSKKKTKLPERSLFFQVHRGLRPQRYQNTAVVTQRYKLVGYPGTFGDENLMQQAEPVLELYDVSIDPGEATNLMQSKPETAVALRQQYEDWFTEVQKTRNFTPGTIIVDKEKEDPSVLCRYQDGSYFQGVSQGWMVQIKNAGLYQVQIHRNAMQKPGKLFVNWRGQQTHEYLQANEVSAEFELSAGTGMLDIWFQVDGEDRVYPANNSTLGDVTLKQIK
ncbi:arylsulfatase [uncultured Gimesia sp.]|uniref:arylsulfatase n=1 Tax=uncultured Gimesia sp. TaxID=1678688 RepID=UPI0030DD284C|tara:strand:+ start:79277 stop:80977 length:1701 start_codon:yes stop_codon:yes gene_type:complete